MIFPQTDRHPFYIVAPPYTRLSAGVRVMHLLCHALNASGERAFIVTEKTDPTLLTPLLTDETIEAHYRKRLAPIAVYPETLAGNALNAPVVVRYVLNFPGLLGGDRAYPRGEICFGYSPELLSEQDASYRDNVLFLPVSDPAIFYPPQHDVVRRGSCFYAGKYKYFHGGKLLPITRNAVEIHGPRGSGPPQSSQEIADLFRRSEMFYCYENSSLATEAVLCGCPVVMLPNEFFTRRIAVDILGTDGIAWGDSPAEVERARRTVHRFRERYLALSAEFWSQLDRFISFTQSAARRTTYSEKVTYNSLPWEKTMSERFAIIRREKGLRRAVIWGAGATLLSIADTGIANVSKKFLKLAAKRLAS